MNRSTLILLLVVTCCLVLPFAVLADEFDLARSDLKLDARAYAPAINVEIPASLLDQLMAQEVSFQLDQDSNLKFSCNIAGLSGATPDQSPEIYAALTPDIQIELAVRF